MCTDQANRLYSSSQWLKFHCILLSKRQTDRQVTICRSTRGRKYIALSGECTRIIACNQIRWRCWQPPQTPRCSYCLLHWHFEYYVNKRSVDRVTWIINALATQINLHQSHPVFCCLVCLVFYSHTQTSKAIKMRRYKCKVMPSSSQWVFLNRSSQPAFTSA